MKRFWLPGLGLALLSAPSYGVTESNAPVESTTTLETPAIDRSLSEGTEEKEQDIIPRDPYSRSSGPAGGVGALPPQTPYEQAKEELIRAINLWNAGHAEAASDTALEAYDDLAELRRVPGVKRSKIRGQMHQAATVYIEAGIAYIKSFVKKSGGTPESIQEGRARLEDLRDVAMGYPELNRMINRASEQLPAAAATRSK